jgi:hypothetical protein
MTAHPRQITLDRQQRNVVSGCGLLLFGLLIALALRRHPAGVAPDTQTVFTSTRCVTGLAIATDGAVWVATPGGILEGTPQGQWRKYTRRDGLPSNEVRRIEVTGGIVTAYFPQNSAVWRDGRWQSRPDAGSNAASSRPLGQTASAVWRGMECVATVKGLQIHERAQGGGRWRSIPLPPSTGTHISALLPHGDSLWGALFGDGLWSYDGRRWRRQEVGLPAEAREITAMAGVADKLWVGTWRAGVWERLGGYWVQHLQPDEPISENCEAVAMFKGRLYVSTLEDGLAVRTLFGWGHFQSPRISSDAPRQMVVYRDTLYLRHGSGKVDAFDGTRWRCDVCAGLPRKQATALAADTERLYVAQWGGWSEFDGTRWAHHLDLPELQGLPITALCPDGDALWVGTQGRGVAEVSRRTGRLHWHDERDGLPDDWVTALAHMGDSVTVGTFVGGLATWDGRRWAVSQELRGQNVTDLAPDGDGGLFVATRNGVWRRSPEGALASLNRSFRFLDREAQALCATPDGLWIGTRTGLYFTPH